MQYFKYLKIVRFCEKPYKILLRIPQNLLNCGGKISLFRVYVIKEKRFFAHLSLHGEDIFMYTPEKSPFTNYSNIDRTLYTNYRLKVKNNAINF